MNRRITRIFSFLLAFMMLFQFSMPAITSLAYHEEEKGVIKNSTNVIQGNEKISKDSNKAPPKLVEPVKLDETKLKSSFSGEDEVVPEVSEEFDFKPVGAVEADGSKIESLSVDWVTEDAVKDNNDSQLNVKWHDDGLQKVQLRINYALSGGYDYPAGSIQISVPKKIFRDRDGNLTGITKLAVLEAPDKSGDFAYVEREDSYVFINTKKLSAATQGYMEMSFEDLRPHTIKDKVTGYKTDDFSANIKVQTKNNQELSLSSNKINAVVDTRAWVSEASKRAYYRPREMWSKDYPSELKPSNDKDYVYMTYDIHAKANGSQPFSLKVVDKSSMTAKGNPIVLGYKKSDGKIVKGNNTDTLTDPNNFSGFTTGYNFYATVYVAYPNKNMDYGVDYKLSNNVDFVMTSVDDKEQTKSSASDYKEYRKIQFLAPEGHFWVDKRGDHQYNYALNKLQKGEDVELEYWVRPRAFGYKWTIEQGKNRDDINNYKKVPYKVITTDENVRYDGYKTSLDKDDFEFTKLTFKKPVVYDYQKYQQDGRGYFENERNAIEYGEILQGYYGYIQDKDDSKIPDLNLKISYDGKTFEDYATVSYKTGKCIITKKDGKGLNSETIDFPKNVVDFRVEYETLNPAVIFEMKPFIKLKSSENIKNHINKQLESTDTPTNYVWNRARMDVKLYKQMSFINTEAHYDMISAFAHGSILDKKLVYDGSKENNIRDRFVDLKYSITMTNQTNIQSKNDLNEVIKSGLYPEQKEAIWYDLLPKGVVPNTRSLKINNGTILDVKLIENYKNTDRTLMIVKTKVEPKYNYSSKENFTGYEGYNAKQVLTYDAKYTWESLGDYGKKVDNVVAFESLSENVGNIKGYKGEPDNPLAENNHTSKSGVSNVADIMTNLNKDHNNPVFLYSHDYTDLIVNTIAKTSLRKDVDVNEEGVFGDGQVEELAKNVFENGLYTYRLRIKNTDTTKAKDIVFYDNLEKYVPDKSSDDYKDTQWKGTFVDLDLSSLKAKGIRPVVYYSTRDDLDLQNENDRKHNNLKDSSIWTTTMPKDKSTIKAIAIDASKKEDGSDYVLGLKESISAFVKMKAPEIKEANKNDYFDKQRKVGETEEGLSGGAHAYNSVVSIMTQIDAKKGVESKDKLINYGYTKVGLKPFSIKVKKNWDDDNNRDGKRVDEVTLRLYANGKKTDNIVKLNKDNKWSGEFAVTYLDENSKPIQYSISEDEVEGYNLRINKIDETKVGINYDVSNVHVPEKIDFKGTKKWFDDNDKVRPKEIKLNLYANDKLVKTQNIRGTGNNWEYEFKDLFKYENGKLIDYKVKEEVTDKAYYQVVKDNVIENHYYPYGDVELEKKVLNGTNATKGKEYEFTVYFKGKDGKADGSSYKYEIINNSILPNGKGELKNGYTFKLKENQKIVIKDVSIYSKVEFKEKEKAGFKLVNDLRAEPKANDKVSLVAQNDYKTTGKINIKAKKVLENKDLNAYDFIFDLYKDGKIIKSASNLKDGLVYFSSLYFDNKDVGKTYEYVIKERVNDSKGMTFDTHEEKVKVSIKDNGDGTLTITPDYGENTPQFKNIYKATGDLSIKAYKKVKGSVDKTYPTFNFVLKNKATGLKVAEGVNNDKGEINFSKIKFAEKDIGKTFEFIAEEIKGNDKNIIYDNSQIQYTVKVVDNGDGKLSFDVITKDLKTDDINNKENEPVFVNKYLPGKLKVEKRIQNGDPNKEFKFKIKFTGDEKDIPTGKFNLTRDKLKEPLQAVFEVSEGKAPDPITLSLEEGTHSFILPKADKWYYDWQNNGKTYKADTLFSYTVDSNGNIAFDNKDLVVKDNKIIFKAFTDKILVKIVDNNGSKDMLMYSAEGNVGKSHDLNNIYWAEDSTNIYDKTFKAGTLVNIANGDICNVDKFTSQGHLMFSGLLIKNNISFFNSSQAKEINLQGFDTSKATDMNSMFYNAHSTTINLGDNFDTSNVTNMRSMFASSQATTINLGDKFDTSKVTNMEDMFRGSQATTINFGDKFDTSNVTNMNGMFHNSQVTTINLGDKFDTSNVTDMHYMFYDSKAITINLGNKFDISKVTNMGYMFYKLKATKVYIGDNVSQSSIDKMINKGWLNRSRIIRGTYQALNKVNTMFAKNDLANDFGKILKSSRTALVSLIKPTTSYAAAPRIVHSGTMGTTTWEIFDNRELVLRPTSGSVGEFTVNDYSGNYAPWHNYEGTFDKIRVEGTVRPIGSLYKVWIGFFEKSQAKEINLQGFDTSNVTNMEHMFYNSQATTINLGDKFDTSNVTNMDGMFYNSQATTINFGDKFDTSNVTNMDNMFRYSQATTINLGDKFDTSNVTNMSHMFTDSEAEIINLGDMFNTKNVENMQNMFYRSQAMTINLGDKFDTSNVTIMSGMFYEAKATKIYIPSNFKFKDDTKLADMAYNSLKYLYSWSREDKTYIKISSWDFADKFNSNPSAMAGWWVRDKKPTSYTVKFNSNGANGLVEDMKVKYGDSFKIPDASNLYLFNKEFVEWNTSPDGTGTSYKAGGSYSNLANIGETVTLYAIFKDKDNSVEIKNGEGEFTLRANESVTFDNLPSGLEYEIYEETDEGWQLVEAKNDKGVIKPNEEIVSTFTNKYDPKSTNAYIKGRKLLDGQGASGYKFNLIKDNQVVDTQTSTEGGFISFKKLDFNTKGEFNYTIKEVKGGDNNIIYDGHEEKVKVVVSEDKKGNLKADITYDSDGVIFNNKTKPSKLVLKKLVEGTDNKTKNFKFSVNIDGNVQEITLKNNEVKEFTNLKADSRYEIKELNIPDGYKLKSIDKASGIVGVNEVVNVIATNEYNAKGSFNIKATKLLENKDLKQGQFKFVLLDENNKTVAESNNDSNGNIDFGLVDIEKAGNFTYKIKEINDSQKDIVYDTHEEIVKVNAVDENNGNLKVNVAYDADGAVFKNNYKPEIPKEENFGNLKISKNVLNLTDSIKNKEYSFKISLTKDNKPLAGEYNAQSSNGLTQVVKNGATLTIKNNEILTIEKLPENVDVKIEEILPKGFELNSNSVVQTKIIKDKTSELKLVNEYKPIGSFNFKGTKKLLGKDISKYKFTFTVVKDGELIQKAYNNEDGEILFKDITLGFEDIGKTYEYEIFESNDRQKDIKYDDKIYKVKVEIKDDGEGNITGVVNTDDIIFTNAHQQLVVTGLNSSMIVMVSLLGLIAIAYVIKKRKSVEE
ncbi:Spy0128 family protein [Finegoldia magna]|uniref:Uncharacterized protein n=1 Tax=Finegoldia magna (strain ATCC 29328 / DSM 20472 / WAL 2508) TaxID=334413 RepID=B0S4I4_FINM2|nr:FctA domain-containing protein [Finegoldia magna]BAG09175.1 conserved hypothetical protein [Finegoldia magna ATCC 29328]